MRKRKRTRSRSRTEKREDEPPPGPIIILEPSPGGGPPLIWLQQTGGNPPAPLVASSQPSNGSLRNDFIGIGIVSFEVADSSYQPVVAIRATTLDGTRVLEVRNQGGNSPLLWKLTQGTPPTTTTLAPTASFNPGEVPLDLTGFEKLEYQAGSSWILCRSFRFQVHIQGELR